MDVDGALSVKAHLERLLTHLDAKWAAVPAAAKASGLERKHCLALMLYSSQAYNTINGPLRQLHRMEIAQHPLPVTTATIDAAVRILRGVQGASGDVRTLWRGVQSRGLSSTRFFENGGTELGMMSTTSKLRESLEFALEESVPGGGVCHALLLKLRIDSPLQRGAHIAWLSDYPEEEEYVYAPRTYLRVVSPRWNTQKIVRGNYRVTVVEVVPTYSW